MKLMTLIGLALFACGAQGSPAPDAAQALARQMAGRWRFSTPGPRPLPRGLLSLRFQAGTLSGTYTPPAGHAIPLRKILISDERLVFRFTLTGQGKEQTFRGRFTPTLDADAWTGHLSGPAGTTCMDMVRQSARETGP